MPPPLRVAQYVRMSTDHQRYSTENQGDANHAYAAMHGMTIVRTYEDAGISGLRIKNRLALQRLLADVESGKVDFEAVLVYDVSRWGRFRNADEAASYEFRCTLGGVRVVYVAESFTNDGSMQASVFKAVMRVMSYSYSKDLSDKVYAGHCKLFRLGFHQGGVPGFALRRQVVGENRVVKGLLEPGDRKGLQDDNVVLVPGPDDEVATVVQVFRLFVEDRLPESVIARRLNSVGSHTASGRDWSGPSIRQILTCERYIGLNVYNRCSFRLSEFFVRNDPADWLRSPTGEQPIVPMDLWDKAQAVFLERSLVLDDQTLLSRLRSLYEREGTLSGLLIDEQEDMPSSSAYRSRFGGLLRAYALIGYDSGTDRSYVATNMALRAMYPDVIQAVVTGFADVSADVSLNRDNGLLTVNGQWTATVVLARCASPKGQALHWTVRFDEVLRPAITVVVRMDRENLAPLDYYLFSRLHLQAIKSRLGQANQFSIEAFRFDTLSALYELGARSPLRNAA